ncbi:hypothetical protein RND71_023444 [Anisodus tanguticus]|uniref:Uncharacterized protein n=1 Tax=Anisodus tanguticus TaxID=243964 RepID=A0AAE1VDS4_9SOLA|nr:hypothetical protein RND71_023444 [Anisodus tanguticus]
MKNLKEESSEMFSEPSRDYEKKDFLKSNWFHMIPKGVPIPPSAPSDRHNYYHVAYNQRTWLFIANTIQQVKQICLGCNSDSRLGIFSNLTIFNNPIEISNINGIFTGDFFAQRHLLPVFFSQKMIFFLRRYSCRIGTNLKEESSEMFSEPSRDYEKKDFLKSNWFHMIPKGVPIPPSAPSDRHNYYKESNDIVSDRPTLPAVKRSGAKALA